MPQTIRLTANPSLATPKLYLWAIAGTALGEAGGYSLTEGPPGVYRTEAIADAVTLTGAIGELRAAGVSIGTDIVRQSESLWWVGEPPGVAEIQTGLATSEELSQSFSISILPGVLRQSELQQGSRLRAYVRQTAPIVASVYDSANQPIDLDGRTLEFRIARADGRDWLTIPNGSINVIGVDRNTITFDPPEGLTAAAGLFPWSLRDATTVLAPGDLEIIFAP